MGAIGWIILIIVAVLIIAIIAMYNGLVSSRIRVDNAWSQIDVQLQRRFDLIPNFVETVKGYASHESETLEKVTSLRTSWANANTVAEKAELDNQLSGALKTIMAVSENYPDLKSSQNYIQLSDELAGTENRISQARRQYNEAVKEYNLSIRKFPANIIAGMFNFDKKPYFEAEEGSNKVPEVNFD